MKRRCKITKEWGGFPAGHVLDIGEPKAGILKEMGFVTFDEGAKKVKEEKKKVKAKKIETAEAKVKSEKAVVKTAKGKK